MPRLTKRTVEALQPGTTDYLVFDDEMPGFGVRIYPTGRKAFLVQYRSGGRTRRLKIGVFGHLTADEARQQARQRLGEVAKGENPAEDIHARRQAPTVAEVCERFLADHVAHRCKPSTQHQYRRMVDRVINPALGTHKIVDITRTDIAAFHHSLRHTPYEANRVLAAVSKMFNLTELWGLRPDGSNPCRHVHRYRERARERFLSPEEIRNLGRVLDEVEREQRASASVVAALRMLILTGCRAGEILTLKWDYIDGDYLRLPDTKTGSRKIPLGPAHKAVLAGIARVADNPFVFSGTKPGRHLPSVWHQWRRIRERAGLHNVRIHDLRHTYASNALASGLPLEMVGKLLGHTQIQTTARYAHLADGPIRDAAKLVSTQLGEFLGGRPAPAPQPPPAAVTPLHRAPPPALNRRRGDIVPFLQRIDPKRRTEKPCPEVQIYDGPA